MKVALFPFSEHEYGLDGIEFLAHVVPEIEGNVASNITAVAVDIELRDPVGHSLGHVLADTGLRVIEVDNV